MRKGDALGGSAARSGQGRDRPPPLPLRARVRPAGGGGGGGVRPPAEIKGTYEKREVRQHGIVVFDNRSGFPKGFSGPSLVFGDGFRGLQARALYHRRRVRLQGEAPGDRQRINIPSDRADLLSRFVALEVPPISAEERLPESRFWEEFEEERG